MSKDGISCISIWLTFCHIRNAIFVHQCRNISFIYTQFIVIERDAIGVVNATKFIEWNMSLEAKLLHE